MYNGIVMTAQLTHQFPLYSAREHDNFQKATTVQCKTSANRQASHNLCQLMDYLHQSLAETV